MIDDLPSGWAAKPLRSLVSKLVDGSHNPPPKQADGLPMLSARNIVEGKIVLDQYRKVTKAAFAAEHARTRVAPGDVLLTIVGSVGRVAVVPGEAKPFCVQRSVAVMTPAGLDPVFLARQLESPRIQSQLGEVASGTAQKGVYLKALARLELVVPPIDEQMRIVAKVEALFVQVNAARERLTRAREILKRFRQSVLAAACSGRLTEEWRARHAPEPLSADAVLAAHRQSWIRAETTRRARQGGRPIADADLFKRYGAPAEPDAPGDAPDSWLWTTLDQITLLSGGLTKGQKRRAHTKMRPVPYLRVANVQRGHLDLSVIKEIEATDAQIAELELQSGDILLNEGGDIDKLGRGWVWEGQIATCIHQNHVFRARPVAELVNPYFVSHYANAVGQDFFLNAGAQTVNLASVSLSKVRTLPVPLPPLAEQAEIVRRVGALFAHADAIEDRLRTAEVRGERLSHAILASAFRGELPVREASGCHTT